MGGMRADGLDTQLQGVCDFGMGSAPAEKLQHFRLARSERGGRGRVAALNQVTIVSHKHASAVRGYVGRALHAPKAT
jgi:hypothetical protein